LFIIGVTAFQITGATLAHTTGITAPIQALVHNSQAVTSLHLSATVHNTDNHRAAGARFNPRFNNATHFNHSIHLVIHQIGAAISAARVAIVHNFHHNVFSDVFFLKDFISRARCLNSSAFSVFQVILAIPLDILYHCSIGRSNADIQASATCW
jgi:hypothetical protein